MGFQFPVETLLKVLKKHYPQPGEPQDDLSADPDFLEKLSLEKRSLFRVHPDNLNGFIEHMYEDTFTSSDTTLLYYHWYDPGVGQDGFSNSVCKAVLRYVSPGWAPGYIGGESECQ